MFISYKDFVGFIFWTVAYEPDLSTRPSMIVPAKRFSFTIRINILKSIIYPTIRTVR